MKRRHEDICTSLLYEIQVDNWLYFATSFYIAMINIWKRCRYCWYIWRNTLRCADFDAYYIVFTEKALKKIFDKYGKRRDKV